MPRRVAQQRDEPAGTARQEGGLRVQNGQAKQH